MMNLLTCSQIYAGGIGFNSYAGYAPLALLQKEDKAVRLSVVPFTGRADLMLDLASFLAITVGGSTHHARIVYTEPGGIVYAGVFNAYAGNASLALLMGSVELHFMGEYLPKGVLSVKAQIDSQVNDRLYKRSTLLKYQGKQGTMARFSIIKSSENSQLWNFIRMRFGLSVEALNLPLSKESINIKSNQSGVGPNGEWERPVAYFFRYASASIIFGIMF